MNSFGFKKITALH